MKIELIITDSKKGIIKIPIKRELFDSFFDIGFMLHKSDELYVNMKLNNVLKSFYKFHDISAEVLDILDDGKVYTVKNDKLIESKDKYFLSDKKPKWKKIDIQKRKNDKNK